MEYRTSSTVYKNFSNARSFNDKSAYDGVFVAPSKHGAPVFSARVEDYREIFGGSRVSSIPILDVPALSDKKFPVDVRSSKVEYSKIFGGFDELNFAIPYDDLLAEANKAKSISKETRTSAGRGSAAVEHSSQYEKGNSFSTLEASSQPFDRMEKFSVSYQKINQGSKSYATETAQVALPHVIPGFSCLIDEHSPVQMCGTDIPTSEKLNDICPENIGSEVANKAELLVSSDGDCKQTSRSTNPTNCQKRSGWFRSDSADKLFNGYEVDQGVQNPETPPKFNFLPKFGTSDGFSGKTTGLNSETFEQSKDSFEVSSPPYFGEEIEVNPVAAASVAVLRKAIDAAQERIKIAKESMERKKAFGLRKHKKTRSSKSLNPEERREVRTSNNSSTCQENMAGKAYGKVVTSEEAIAESREGSLSTEYPVTQRAVRENLNATETNSVEFKSTKVDYREEEAKELDATEQFYEPLSFGKDEAKELEPLKEDSADGHGCHGNHGLKETFENPVEYGDSLVMVEKAKVHEESGINLSVVKGIFMSKLKSVLGVVDHAEDKITYGINQLETERKVEASMEHEKCVELLEEFQVTKDREEFAITEMGENNDMGTKVQAHQWAVEEVRHVCQQEEKERETNAVQIENDVEKTLDKSSEEEININLINDFHDGEEAHDMQEDVESKENEELQENKQDDEMIERLSFHLYNNEIEHHVLRQTNIGECAVHKNIVTATTDNLHTENKIEPEDGLCMQDECDNLSEDQDANNFIESLEEVQVITDQPEYRDTDISTEITNISFEVLNNESEAITEDVMEDRLPFKLFSMAEDALKRRELRVKMEDSDASHISIQKGLDFGVTNIKLEQMQHDASVDWSSIFCSLGNSKCMAPELQGIERNIDKIEVAMKEENDDSNEEEILSNVNDIEAGNQPGITEDYKISEEVVEETVISTEATENHQATIKVEESETDYVLKNEMELEFDENNTRAGSQSGMIEMDSEIIHEIKTSQSREESEKSYQEIMTEDEVESTDSSDIEVEYAVHFENLEEADSPRSSERQENLENIEQEISTSQTVTENDSHPTTPSSGEIEIKAELQREEGIGSKFNNETGACGLPQAKDGVEELVENSTNRSILENGVNHQATRLMQEEKASHEKFEKEAEVTKERQRKIDEPKEKERERERLAVERAIREARERAFAEARERAAIERASAGTRRRAMAEPRERSGKVSIEANSKPSAEKVSKEAKLKAQRVAVEMATAEARERALDRAMSEKAISEARNLADKIVAEKLNGAAGVSKVKKSFSFSDSQPKSQSSSSNFRHANSFNLGEKEVGSAGESAQRSKARLERHQRTVERVAKAIAEKNIRDILVQKEQEERNRLAEGLDGEVKRWSSGKEGNLRALLSTLQYILGPDSGWQPVPLTDIITAAAVKRAYRKATLYVHPDKLQQRGASIQQKYVCEKVFDLLKAAWNRFNVEERL